MNPLNVYAYDRLSKALKIALDLNEITLDDLLEEDDNVYKRLEKSNSNDILRLIKSINSKVTLVENKEEYDIFQKNKLRIIDPTIVIEDKLFKSSDKSNLIHILTEKALNKFKEGIYIKII